MTTDQVRPAKRTRVLLLSSTLVFANLVALFVELILVLRYYDEHESTNYLVPQDIWGPFLYAIWAQAIVNGLILLPWRSTRRVGFGFLLGTVGTVVTFILWIFFVVLPDLY